MIPKKLQDILLDLQSSQWLKPISNIAEVFVVGGSVRDAFIGKSIKDIDLIVEGLPLQKIQGMLKPFGKVDIVGESFSVIKFKPMGFNGEPYDIATPRMDRKIGAGHKGFEIITDGVDILTDLKRRDFTINSMAIDVETGKLIDPFNGHKDLMVGVLRATDNNAFIEDPLRILRGIQFAARFGFDIEPNTMRLMQENSGLIKEITGERIFEELMKILTKKGNTDLALNLLSKTGVDKALFGKEISTFDELGCLDVISFFYVLGLLGDVDPANFLKNRLKGDNVLVNDVRILDQIISELPKLKGEEEDLKFMLFKKFNKAPNVMNANALPKELDSLVNDFRNGNIPLTPEDIAINGNDVMVLGNLKEGPEVGKIKEKFQRDALMNRFNWKDRSDSLEYLQNLND